MLGLLQRAGESGYFIRLRDMGIFLLGARTDALITRLQATMGHRDAFETLYRDSSDPWASISGRYRYQRRKYEVVTSLLPTGRRFQKALDLGCGLGELTRMLADRVDTVLGLDVAQSAVDRARAAHGGLAQLHFDQGDILDLPRDLDGQFDLVTIADTLYYLTPMSDALMKSLAVRVAALLAPGGVCVLVNHFFFGRDAESKVSQRIHRAFEWSPRFRLLSEHWRPFYLVSLLEAADLKNSPKGDSPEI